MTTLSTTQLIEAMRTVAVAADTEQGREKLNAIANRMEMLVAANAGMDLQLNSIRSALNIPVNTSVQAGVIAETSRLNDEVLSLRSELSESVALANKLRRTAKEHQEENQQLRTELAELRGQEPDLYLCPVTRSGEKLFSPCGRDYPRGRGYYTHPVPPAASQPVRPIGVIEAKAQGTDTYTLKCFYRPEGTSNLVGQKVYAAPPASQPYTVPDEATPENIQVLSGALVPRNGGWHKMDESECYMAVDVWNACRSAMLQSDNSPVWIGIDWAKGCEPDNATETQDDTRRMNWLASHVVEVREPLPYGSHAIFFAQCDADDDEPYHTRLREQIDEAMLAAAPQVERRDGDTVSPDTSAVPDGYALVSIDLLNKFPELNICNYNHDDVGELNSWGIELVSSTDQKPISKDGDA